MAVAVRRIHGMMTADGEREIDGKPPAPTH